MARNGLDYSDDFPTGPKRPNPFDTSTSINLDDDPSTPAEDKFSVERPDGSVTINIFDDDADTSAPQPPSQRTGFDRNLAEDLDEEALNKLSADLMEGIQDDLDSRREWMDTRAKGIKMLALNVEEPQQGVDHGPTSAPLEGQSRVRHTIMLEATVAFQAGARGELLPAGGPVKIQNVTPSGAPQDVPDSGYPQDQLANALQQDLNYWLKSVAKEYIPDTDRMFFQIPWSGDGFRKGYHCPIRRRPVIESIDAEDLIVSNAATDLHSCGRVTHRIKMKRSTLRRMQLLGSYRDVDIPREPEIKPQDDVKKEKEAVAGQKQTYRKPKDADYEIYECYCEIDEPLGKFAPRHLKNTGLPLPYKVTIETTSRKILEVRRRWKKEDRECKGYLRIVQYPFVRGLGFYGLGFVHLLGNATMALTAAYRLMLDAGMMSNFPGLIGDKQALRQLTNQFRVPPGGAVGIDVPSGKTIQQVVMSVPYKEVGPAFPAFIQHMEDRAKSVAMVSNAAVGEGKQDAPVGTTLALIEQATKIESSAFRRLHDAQTEEFHILKDLFLEDPEAMWRHAKGINPSGMQWQRTQFITALNSYSLVPVADPNNPTSLHRAMKSALLKMLAMQSPQLYDMVAVDRRILDMAGIDTSGIWNKAPPSQAPDPMAMAMQARQQMMQMQAALRQQEQQLKAALAIQDAQGKAADRASKEKIEHLKLELQRVQQEEQAYIERLKMYSQVFDHIRGMAQDHRDGVMAAHEHGLKRDQFDHQRQQDQHAMIGQQQDRALKQHQTQHAMSLDQIGHQLGFLGKQQDQANQQQDRADRQGQFEANRADKQGQFEAQRQDRQQEFTATQEQKAAETKAKAKQKPKGSE